MRGASSPPNFPLTALQNVGGFCAVDRKGDRTVARIPVCGYGFGDHGIGPYKSGSGGSAADEHFKYLNKIGALGVYGIYDPETKLITGREGIVMKLPVIARYSQAPNGLKLQAGNDVVVVGVGGGKCLSHF